MNNNDERDYAEEEYNRAEMEREAEESDIFAETDRTLTTLEFDAIRTFQSNWGYTGNDGIGDDLVDMLANTHTPTETLISRFLRKWDLSEEIRMDVENLFIVRKVAEDALSTQKLRRELFQEESDKRVERFFIQRSGWVWVVYHISDIPEAQDSYTAKFTLPAMDGTTTMLTTSLHMTEQKAWEHIESIISDITYYDPETLTHVIELDKM